MYCIPTQRVETRINEKQRLVDMGRGWLACVYLNMRYTEAMKIISNSALRTFAADHPQAEAPLQGWRRVIEKNRFANWAELKAAFNAVDRVGELVVFDIGGNKYRLIAYIRFERQILYIKAVLTHREYAKGAWKS
jgi:mRNA interferase HigB